MTEALVTTTDKTEMEAWGKSALDLARNVKVDSVASLEAANTIIGEWKGFEKRIHSLLDPGCEAAHAAWKAVTNTRAMLLRPFEQARLEILQPKMARFQAEERERLRKAAEEAQRAATAAHEAIKPEVVEALVAEGRSREDAEIMASAVAPVVPVPEAPRVEGFSTREVWRWRVVDENAVPDAYWQLNTSLLDSTAKTGKGGVAVPGIEFYLEHIGVRR